jgi:hypothetical protein
MQTLIQVLATKSGSLRQTIVNDGRLKKYRLSVSKEKKKGRKHGWAKIHSDAKMVMVLSIWNGMGVLAC